MDRMDIITAWLNKFPVQIPELGTCQIYDVEREDGSGYSFNLTVLVIGPKGSYGAKRKVYVSTHPGEPVIVKVSGVKTTMTKTSRVKTTIAAKPAV